MSSSERNSSASLTPCPFCGDVPTTIEADEAQGYKWGRVRCCIQGPEVRTGYDTSSNAAWHAEAIAAWNRRAQASAEPSDVQMLAITTAYEQGIGKGHQAHGSGREISNPYAPSWGCKKAWALGFEEGKLQAAREAGKAPPQWSPLTPEALADRCEAWLECGKSQYTTNLVDAFEDGFRDAEVVHGITAAKESNDA